ncbi:MAG: alpha/beta fold hydrolase [Brevibacterium sp.]
MGERVGGFRSDVSKHHFMEAFDAAMTQWPPRTDHRVNTEFGSTTVSIANTPPAAQMEHPLVLLQGGGSTIAAWARFVDVWRNQRPVIAIDTLWEAGRSVQTQPVVDGALAAAWLEQTLSQLGIDHAHIVGYSYGGWLALNHGSEAPSRVLSVTAIEPVGAITPLPLRAWWNFARMLIGGQGHYRTYLEWVRGGRIDDSAMLDLMLSARRDYVQRGSPRPNRLSAQAWGDLSIPTAIILGGRSRFITEREVTEVLHDLAPQVEVHVLPDSSHAALLDEPEWVASFVEQFVQRHDRTSR